MRRSLRVSWILMPGILRAPSRKCTVSEAFLPGRDDLWPADTLCASCQCLRGFRPAGEPAYTPPSSAPRPDAYESESSIGLHGQAS